MATITTAAPGNWSVGGNWIGGVAPGDGDSAILAHSMIVDVPVTVGTQPATGGTAAIAFSGSATVTLTVNDDLIVKGDITQTSNYQTVSRTIVAAGVTVTFFPASGQQYKWACSEIANIEFNGSSGSHCVLTTDKSDSGLNSYISCSDSRQNGLRVGTYLDIENFGDTTNWGVQTYYGFGAPSTGNVEPINLSHVTMTNCSYRFNDAGGQGTGNTVTIEYLKMIDSADRTVSATGYCVNWVAPAADGFARNVRYCLFDGKTLITSATGLDISANYFQDQIVRTGSTVWNSFTDNVVSCRVQDAMLVGGDFSDNYFASFVTNPHYLTNQSTPATIESSGNLFDCPMPYSDGDCHLIGAATQVWDINRNIVLPNSQGSNSGTLLTLFDSADNVELTVEHNTYYAGQSIAYNEPSGGITAGRFSSVKSNLTFSTHGVQGSVMADVSASPTEDVGDPADLDYNCRYNVNNTTADPLMTNNGRGYLGKWTVTPGANDTEANPRVLDETRNLASFDTVFLGNAASATWASKAGGYTFTVGEIISNNNADYYFGQVINFRCIQEHTKSTTDSEPGLDANDTWLDYWELASEYRIREALTAGTTITNAAYGLTNATYNEALMAWVKVGFRPTNAAIATVGHDGTTPGAQEYLAPLTVTGDPPTVAPSGTHTFAATGNAGTVSWSLTGGSVGSINSGSGQYTAPSTIAVQQSLGGRALLAPNHIYNVDISAMPVNPDNATWIGLVNGNLNVNQTQFLRYSFGFPTNYLDGTEPDVPIVTAYTPSTDGNYPMPLGKNLLAENGARIEPREFLNNDHHIFTMDLATDEFQEFYQWYPPGTDPALPLTTSRSTTGQVPCMNGKFPYLTATDAGGAYLFPLTIRVSEWRRAVEDATGINHCARITLRNTEQLGNNVPLWPATAYATAGSVIPYGARMRIQSSYVYGGSNPYTEALIEQGKKYGYLVLDGSPFPLEVNINGDEWPNEEMIAAIAELRAITDFSTNMEFIDESSLNPYPDDAVYNRADSALTTEGVFAQVVATDGIGNTGTKHVLLDGAAVDFLQNQYVIRAGANPVQLLVGANHTTVSYSLSAAVGSVNSSGVYTPPATLAGSTPTVVTVIAEADADASKKAYATIVIIPNPALQTRLLIASEYPTTPPANYTDPDGKTWIASGWGVPDWTLFTGNAFMYSDVYPHVDPLYEPSQRSYGDLRGVMYLKPGSYKITLNLFSWVITSPVAPIAIECQGNTVTLPFDTTTKAGGASEPFSVPFMAFVPEDGKLSLNIRTAADAANNIGGFIGSVLIEPMDSFSGNLNFLRSVPA